MHGKNEDHPVAPERRLIIKPGATPQEIGTRVVLRPELGAITVSPSTAL